MSGGTAKPVKFSIRFDNYHDAIMCVSWDGGLKDYALTQDDLYRLQNESQECIIMNIKRGRELPLVTEKEHGNITRGAHDRNHS